MIYFSTPDIGPFEPPPPPEEHENVVAKTTDIIENKKLFVFIPGYN